MSNRDTEGKPVVRDWDIGWPAGGRSGIVSVSTLTQLPPTRRRQARKEGWMPAGNPSLIN
ncbi:MAG: hypothetical protein U5K69_19115 [Balneolaceae bacterium]|nr:hypothetical protein [Balneolaceae bacterium]